MFDSKNNILIVILILCIFYCIYKINNLENKLNNKVENFTTDLPNEINMAVKKIYLADVEAIRLLSNFAIQLSQGGFTIPGNLNIGANITVGNTFHVENNWGMMLQNSGNLAFNSNIGPKSGLIHHDGNNAFYFCKKKADNTDYDFTNSMKVNIENSDLEIKSISGKNNNLDIKANTLNINSEIIYIQKNWLNFQNNNTTNNKAFSISYDPTSNRIRFYEWIGGTGWNVNNGMEFDGSTGSLYCNKLYCKSVVTVT